jgi:hypothetical protein
MVQRVNLDWSPQTMGTILLRVKSRVLQACQPGHHCKRDSFRSAGWRETVGLRFMKGAEKKGFVKPSVARCREELTK